MNESVLIGKSERFLDQIKRKKISLSDIESPEKFLKLYTYLKQNMDTLQDMRETMEIKGYTAPYRSINKYGRPLTGETKAEDMYDVSRHTQYFRMNAAAKKNILDRVKSAMSSHRIAIGHLEEFATLECTSCQRKYKGHEISLIKLNNCQCGGSLELHVNTEGVYRLEIIPFLPLSGDYMVKLSELSPRSRQAFRSMVRILKQEKRGIVKTVSLVIKVMEDGRWVRKRVTIDAHDEANYEKEIRSQYGSNARIEMMQFHRKKPSIINDKQVQTALSLGYVKYAETQILQFLPVLLEESLQDLGKVEEYQEALEIAERKANKYEDGDDQDGLKKFFLKKELKERGLLDKDETLNGIIKQDLKNKELVEKNLFQEIPRIYILWDLLRYYLTTSFDRRNKHSGPFPYLRPGLDSNQMKAFQDFKQDVVRIMQDHLSERIEYIPSMGMVLSSKFSVERKMKGLHLQMGSALGAAIVSIEGNLTVEQTGKLFSITPKEVKKAKETLETLQKPATSKAKQFMAMMKK
jgi:Uncharacterized protein conserved in archaea